MSAIQSVLRENAVELWFEDLANNCLGIVIVYAKVVNREITNKTIVVVYIRL